MDTQDTQTTQTGLTAGDVVRLGEFFRVARVTEGGDVMGRSLSVEDAGGDAGHTLWRLGAVDAFVSYEAAASVTPEHLGPDADEHDAAAYREALLESWPDVDGELAWLSQDEWVRLAERLLVDGSWVARAAELRAEAA